LHEQNRVPALALLTSLFEQRDKRTLDTFTLPRGVQAAGRIHLQMIVARKLFGVKPHVGARVWVRSSRELSRCAVRSGVDKQTALCSVA
jgi:hypothetical protein